MARKARIVLAIGAVLTGLVLAHPVLYGPPQAAPSGVAVQAFGQCAGFTWSNGIGETGFWRGCDD